ncbi:hypothetical protein POM88_003140 [Heracleum sosnowskyi]|uniref:Uncharacterized protein n=1 Tax=Heracleum sosnowskyi TaxID=360622 RepID=A0AAD8JFD1_9APIA|nr:hypothetical protein POM88_003140 [Heracleum sosnowskyi]
MEEMASAVALPFRLGNLMRDNTTTRTHMDITKLKLMTDNISLLADSVAKSPDEYTSSKSEDIICDDSEMNSNCVGASVPGESSVGPAVSDLMSGKENDLISNDAVADKNVGSTEIITKSTGFIDSNVTANVKDSLAITLGIDDNLANGPDYKPIEVVQLPPEQGSVRPGVGV